MLLTKSKEELDVYHYISLFTKMKLTRRRLLNVVTCNNEGNNLLFPDYNFTIFNFHGCYYHIPGGGREGVLNKV